MKFKTLLEAGGEIEAEESDEEVIELGQFVRYMLKAGNTWDSGEANFSTFKKAVEYIQSTPDLDASSAAVALEALAKGRLEEYYNQLKRQNKDLARYF